jgi:(2Fe-2S) ferredoxin
VTAAPPGRRWHVTVCSGPECGDRRGSQSLYTAFERLLAERGLGSHVVLDWQSCFGRCFDGPNVYVRPEQPTRSIFGDVLPRSGPGAALYTGLLPEQIPRIVEQHIVGGEVVRDLRDRRG